jgi:dCTP diphosphatase
VSASINKRSGESPLGDFPEAALHVFQGMLGDVPLNVPLIQAQLRSFVAEREWAQFHSPKNLSMALAAEAGELLEIFQWLTEEESRTLMEHPKRAEAVRHEIADVLVYVLRLADVLGVCLQEVVDEKIRLNAAKYPVALARGNARKYTELRPDSE